MRHFGINGIIILTSAILLLGSCTNNRKSKKIDRLISLDVISVKRYEKTLFAIDTSHLQQGIKGIQSEFKPFLDADLSDPLNISRIHAFISDSVIQSVYQNTIETYPDLKALVKDLTLAFKHIKYYFPDWKPPSVYTYVSGLLYELPVKYDGRNLIIALDMYLSEDFEMYRKIGIPMYKIKRMTPEYILADCIDEIIRIDFANEPLPDNMLDKMVDEGIILYLIDSFLPWIADNYKIGFTSDEITWCRRNESNMWAYFIENELLYSSDPLIINRFINDGPFTAPFHHDSPARAALWVGWQIIRAYMNQNPDNTPADLLLTKLHAREILSASRYKPRRFIF